MTIENAGQSISNMVMSTAVHTENSPGRPDTTQNAWLQQETLTSASQKTAVAPVLLTADLFSIVLRRLRLNPEISVASLITPATRIQQFTWKELRQHALLQSSGLNSKWAHNHAVRPNLSLSWETTHREQNMLKVQHCKTVAVISCANKY